MKHFKEKYRLIPNSICYYVCSPVFEHHTYLVYHLKSKQSVLSIINVVLRSVLGTFVNVLKHANWSTAADEFVDGNRDDTWWHDSCYHGSQSLAIVMDSPNAIEAVYITTLEFSK